VGVSALFMPSSVPKNETPPLYRLTLSASPVVWDVFRFFATFSTLPPSPSGVGSTPSRKAACPAGGVLSVMRGWMTDRMEFTIVGKTIFVNESSHKIYL
jgi:hypothetical protein